MKSEIEAAGFVLEAQSDALRNSEDDHKLAVFDPSIREERIRCSFDSEDHNKARS